MISKCLRHRLVSAAFHGLVVTFGMWLGTLLWTVFLPAKGPDWGTVAVAGMISAYFGLTDKSRVEQ